MRLSTFSSLTIVPRGESLSRLGGVDLITPAICFSRRRSASHIVMAQCRT